MSRFRPVARVLVALAVLALAVPAARGKTPATASGATTTVVQVERMLRAGIGPDVVLAWLERERPPVPRLAAEDLLRLREAGADDDLLRRLVELSGGDDGERAGKGQAPSPAPPAVPDATPAPLPDAVPVRVTLEYRPRRLEDEEPWALYVYLDGRPVAWSPGPRTPFSEPRITFVVPLSPGRHLLRVARERHLPRSLGSRVYRHEARFAPLEIPLDVPPREGLELLLRVREDRRGRARPAISWTVSLGGKVLVDRRNQGPPPAAWPDLCEDVEATLPAGSRLRDRKLERCVRWGDLWKDVPGGVPSRAEVLEELRRYGFRPVPLTAS